MEKKIIILNGFGGCGKDTFVNICKKKVKTEHWSSINFYKIITTQMGWLGTKEQKDRKFLSDLKRLSLQYNDKPFELTKERIELFLNKYNENSLLFIDIRENEEIQKIIQEYPSNIIKVLITNNRIKNNFENYSDAYVYDINYDYVIDNSETIDELEENANIFLKDILSDF